MKVSELHARLADLDDDMPVIAQSTATDELLVVDGASVDTTTDGTSYLLLDLGDEIDEDEIDLNDELGDDENDAE